MGPYETATWMLRIATTSTVQEYCSRIAYLTDLYGPECWHIIYKADVQARKYHLERCRRDLAHQHSMSTARGYYSPFDPSMPWEHAYRHLLQDQAF